MLRRTIAELITIPVEDAVIDALLYRSPIPASTLVICIHGALMNFCVGPSRFLPPMLVQRGFDCLAVNLRGHDLGSIRASFRKPEGWAWHLQSEAFIDLEGVVAFTQREGYERYVLLGHSWGALIAAHFVAQNSKKPSPVALILLSLVHSFKLFLEVNYGPFVTDVLEQARQLIASEAEWDLIAAPPGASIPVMSARTIVDLASATSEPFANLLSKLPRTLLVAGSREHAALLEAYDLLAKTGYEVQIINKAGHFYRGQETSLADTLITWLTPGQ